MYKTKTVKVQVEKEEITAISCDVCNKEYKLGEDEGNDIFETQEFTMIRFTGGYGSIFGDDNSYECHICQRCLNDKLGEYLRNVTELCE